MKKTSETVYKNISHLDRFGSVFGLFGLVKNGSTEFFSIRVLKNSVRLKLHTNTDPKSCLAKKPIGFQTVSRKYFNLFQSIQTFYYTKTWLIRFYSATSKSYKSNDDKDKKENSRKRV